MKSSSSKRWNIVALVNGEEVKFVVRGDLESTARKNAFNNYKGITKILSIEERDVKRSYPVSMTALNRESYEFKLRSKKPHSRKKFYG